MATMRETLYDYCQKRNNTVLLWQWDPVQNGDLTPEKISYGSKQKVWWRCEDGHRWQASVTARTCNESGCPYCMGRRPIPGENDLAHRHPELVAQWHPTKNGSLRPDQILPGSHQRAWWICEKGHVWSATVKSRVSGCGCPVCANREAAACENDLATNDPSAAGGAVASDQKWHADTAGSCGRNAQKGLVAVRKRACMAGICCFKNFGRDRVPCLYRQKNPGGRKRSGIPVSQDRGPVASKQQWCTASAAGGANQQPPRLVAMRAGPFVSGGSFRPHDARKRLPLLRGQAGACRI